jgi:hypothetical protein
MHIPLPLFHCNQISNSMASPNVFLLLPLACLLAMTTITSSARDFPITPAAYYKLAVRREASEGLFPCFNAVMEIKSCSTEIVNFFLKDQQTSIGKDCCRAIYVITHSCWPSMLTSIGFIAGELDILGGYCDAASVPAAAPPPLEV